MELTKDGWFKTPDGIETNHAIKKPSGIASNSAFTLNDNFSGKSLRPQWKFFGEYDSNRVQLVDNSLVLKAKGNSIGNCSPLLCIPSDHSYMAEVELSTEGNAIGGLILFYNNNYYSGILADNENVLANLRGWQFVAENKVIKNHVFLRLKNINNTIDMFYSNDGVKWKKVENSLEVSGMHHNVLSGFLSLRIGLCSIGNGNVNIKNFTYKPMK